MLQRLRLLILTPLIGLILGLIAADVMTRIMPRKYESVSILQMNPSVRSDQGGAKQ